MNKNVIETLVGALVLLVAASFLLFAYKSAGINTAMNGYTIKAKFERVDGVHLGSDVRIGGIKVGSVIRESLDSKTYLAELDMHIDKAVKLPKDSSAQIVSDGLLGGKYIALVPGADEAMLNENDVIEYTQSSVNLETLIGKFMFSSDKTKDVSPAPAVEASPIPVSPPVVQDSMPVPSAPTAQ